MRVHHNGSPLDVRPFAPRHLFGHTRRSRELAAHCAAVLRTQPGRSTGPRGGGGEEAVGRDGVDGDRFAHQLQPWHWPWLRWYEPMVPDMHQERHGPKSQPWHCAWLC